MKCQGLKQDGGVRGISRKSEDVQRAQLSDQLAVLFDGHERDLSRAQCTGEPGGLIHRHEKGGKRVVPTLHSTGESGAACGPARLH